VIKENALAKHRRRMDGGLKHLGRTAL
jgi:hypothetical protein